MRLKVTKNGNIIIVTDNLKHAAEEYNRAIYDGKPGDIIEFFTSRKVTTRQGDQIIWERARKDWL